MSLDAPSPTLPGFDAPFTVAIQHPYGGNLYGVGGYGGSRSTVFLAASTTTLAGISSLPALAGFAVAPTPSGSAAPAWGDGGWGLTPWGGGLAVGVAGQFSSSPSLRTLSSSPTLAVLI